jgi:hypothetical protein
MEYEIEENTEYRPDDKVLVFGDHPGTYLTALGYGYALIACEYPDGAIYPQSIRVKDIRHA